MYQLLVLFAFGFYLVLAGSRSYLIFRGLRGDWPGRRYASFALQISALILILFPSTDLFSRVSSSAAPLTLLVYFDDVRAFGPFIGKIILIPVVCVLVFGAVCWNIKFLRRVLIFVTGCAFAVCFVVAGEIVSKNEMCETAEEFGVSVIQRNSFLWSLYNAPREFQVEIHALLILDEQELGWSYKEMDWYAIPANATASVRTSEYECAAT